MGDDYIIIGQYIFGITWTSSENVAQQLSVQQWVNIDGAVADTQNDTCDAAAAVVGVQS